MGARGGLGPPGSATDTYVIYGRFYSQLKFVQTFYVIK